GGLQSGGDAVDPSRSLPDRLKLEGLAGERVRELPRAYDTSEALRPRQPAELDFRADQRPLGGDVQQAKRRGLCRPPADPGSRREQGGRPLSYLGATHPADHPDVVVHEIPAIPSGRAGETPPL